jgi:hypothetical protein
MRQSPLAVRGVSLPTRSGDTTGSPLESLVLLGYCILAAIRSAV